MPRPDESGWRIRSLEPAGRRSIRKTSSISSAWRGHCCHPPISEENAYFQNRAVDAVVAAFLAADADGGATPSAVSDLLSNPDDLAEALLQVGGPTSRRMQNLLKMDAKTRDPVLSTAQQTFQWCDDERLQDLTSRNTFSLADLCKGDTDLFITCRRRI